MRTRILHIVLLVFIPFLLLGQRRDEGYLRTDTVTTKNIKLIGLPIAFYTPETEFGVGGGGQMFLLKNTNQYNKRLSNILFTGIYTSAGQIIIDVIPQVYLGKGDYFIDSNYRFEIFPNFFWGIGPDTPAENEEEFNQTAHELNVAFLKRLPPYLNFGFSFNFANYQVTEREEGGILDSGDVLGSNRAVIVGLGAEFNKDSRDDDFSPTRGQFLSLSAQFSSELLGATHSFNKFLLDLRQYFPLGKRGTLAAQAFLETNFGDVPFQGMAFFGGSSRARGYFLGRFIDRTMYVFQAEYRFRFTPRWALAGFGLIGSVAGDAADLFEFDSIKPALGGGIRFKVLKDQGTWLRFDIGKGIDGQSGIYFGVNEAF